VASHVIGIRCMTLTWSQLLSEHRLALQLGPPGLTSTDGFPMETRTEPERDHDRLRFSAPVRRLADKTQVFPLERNDSVRTRLTHSEEVSAVARSIGTQLAYNGPAELTVVENVTRRVPAIMAAAGLAHDLGNPPFGHQGETAMRAWFKSRPHLFGEGEPPPGDTETLTEHHGRVEAGQALTPAMKADFRAFEGNAQMLRLVTKLQSSTNGHGLNLTCASLSTLMKYVVPSDRIDDANFSGRGKVGYFASEAATVAAIREHTGLMGEVRHPLTYILEACDDLCYCVVDTEDAVKKGLVSFQDLIGHLEGWDGKDQPLDHVVAQAGLDRESAKSAKLAPAELNDVLMQRFRVHAIASLVTVAIRKFNEQHDTIMARNPVPPLLHQAKGVGLVRALRDFDRTHAYRHKDVLAVETTGYTILQRLMSMLWRGITERESFEDPKSRRTSPFADLVYSHVSENYRRIFEERPRCNQQPTLPMRYRELQLLADNVSGMTDSFAVSLHDKLVAFDVGASHRPV